PKVVGGKLPARIGSCRARQESDGSLALFVFLGFYIFLNTDIIESRQLPWDYYYHGITNTHHRFGNAG
ncbi:hypothetical protein ACXO2Y_07355, partial [Lactobacillus delbrueckii subsp. bulgaricus]